MEHPCAGVKVNGSILTPEGFMEGHIVIENGVVERISDTLVPYPDATGVVVPRFFNHHTHLGDSFIRNPPKLPIDELVGPGGFKHRELERADEDILLAGMERSISVMEGKSAGFIDFREGGIEGVKLIRKALYGKDIQGIILSRPVEWTESEMEALLEMSDGFGISSLSDHEFDMIEMASRMAHEKGKLFSIHFSERVPEDVGKLLELGPDMVIHATEASDEDLRSIADEGIPVVICPRSSSFFGKRPPLARMMDMGVDVRIGTDNGMIAEPDVLKEVQHLYLSTPKAERHHVEKALMGIFERKDLKEVRVGIEEGQKADLLLARVPWMYPEKGLLKASDEDIEALKGEANGRNTEDTDSD